MDNLPNCPLCGSPANEIMAMGQRVVGAQCSDDECPLSHYGFTVANWRKLAAGAKYRKALVAITTDIYCVGTNAGMIARKALED